jgi:formamidopyrimidine-DNA glycosylase
MPELPDVAGFKTYLDSTSLHQRVDATRCFDGRIVKGLSPRSLQRRLKSAELAGSRRWGKWLFVELTSGGHLVLHFGMTGSLDYAGDDRDLPEHARFVLHFDTGRRLAVVSRRMIGRVGFARDVDEFADQQDLGPDALEDVTDADAFIDVLQGRRGAVKSALMNQSILAGIGNVYSDEILFQAGLHPASKVAQLSGKQLRDLFQVTRRVLRVAARKGGDAAKAPSGWLLGRRGKQGTCPQCGGELTSETVSGRTAWLCPSCQTKP